jgi:hypothetical protein
MTLTGNHPDGNSPLYTFASTHPSLRTPQLKTARKLFLGHVAKMKRFWAYTTDDEVISTMSDTQISSYFSDTHSA